MHERPQLLSPLADSQVNDSLLHDSPDLVVDGVQIWAVWRPEVRTDEVRCLLLQQLDGVEGAMCRSAVLLKYKRVTCDTFDCWKHLLRQ